MPENMHKPFNSLTNKKGEKDSAIFDFEQHFNETNSLLK